jgi:short-subunit dehydrogenase
VRDQTFVSKYGPWALIVGGSTGMGAEYARQLAAKGLSIVVLADPSCPPQPVADEVAAAHGVASRALVIDLLAGDILQRIDAETADIEIGLLVYNAAHSVVGRFLDISLADKLRMLDVNCRGPLQLCHHFGGRMAARGRGGIVLVSSLSGFQGQAMVGTYAATKAFDLVLAESLWNELRDDGVDVLALCPGATRTPNFLASQPRSAGALSAPLMEPADTVREALAALGEHPTVIAGRPNRLAAFVLHRVLTRRALINLMSRTTRAMYDRR